MLLVLPYISMLLWLLIHTRSLPESQQLQTKEEERHTHIQKSVRIDIWQAGIKQFHAVSIKKCTLKKKKNLSSALWWKAAAAGSPTLDGRLGIRMAMVSKVGWALKPSQNWCIHKQEILLACTLVWFNNNFAINTKCNKIFLCKQDVMSGTLITPRGVQQSWDAFFCWFLVTHGIVKNGQIRPLCFIACFIVMFNLTALCLCC